MRIPTYRARMAPTSEAPGRSINARMSPQAMAQAELAKAAPAQALTQAIGSYTRIRYDAEQELALNEGLLEAEEMIRQLNDDLSKTKRLGDVFGGANLWKTQISEAREKILDKIGTNRFTRAKFTSRFDQMELSTRFQLKGVIERKIEAAAQAAAAARDAGIVKELSDPAKVNNDEMIGIYNQRFTGTVADKASGVKKGRYSGAAVSKSVSKMQVDIAKSVVGAKVGSSPLMATDLMQAMELQDKLNAGEELSPMDKVRIEDGGYTLHTLMNIPREDAIDILRDALTDATAFQSAQFDAIKRQETEDAEILKSQMETIDESFLRIDPTQKYTPDQANEFLGFLGIADVNDWLPESKKGSPEVTGRDIMGVMRTFAYDNGVVDENKEDFYNRMINKNVMRPKISDPRTIDYLFRQQARGLLTVDEVTVLSSDLTTSDQMTFLNLAQTQGDRATNDAISVIKNNLFYDANIIKQMDATAAAELSNQVTKLTADLNAEIESRRLSGRPMTQNEISRFASDLVKNDPTMGNMLNKDYDRKVADATYQNYFGDLFRQVEGLSYEERPAQLISLLKELLSRDDLSEAKRDEATDLLDQMQTLKRRYGNLR